MCLTRDLVFLILQFCKEENLTTTAQMLEQEARCFFDVSYFEELIIDGNWEALEKYISIFTGVEDNRYSTQIYFYIRKQKYFEALDRHDSVEAVDVLVKDLKVFEKSHPEVYEELTQLLGLDDLRENVKLATYDDALSARKDLANALRHVVEKNPLLQEKTRFSNMCKSRLRGLVNQSLNWQHMHCGIPRPKPRIHTLFTDHKCHQLDDNVEDRLLDESYLHPKRMSANTTSNSPVVVESLVSARAFNLGNLSSEAENTDCHHTKMSLIKNLDEGPSDTESKNNGQDSVRELLRDFPATVKRILETGTPPTSMDFHPYHQTVLLVGTYAGDIEIWQVSTGERLLNRKFMLNDDNTIFKFFPENHLGISINRIVWSPDGTIFGVAYSKRLVRLYSYDKNANRVAIQFEIDAHDGGVNDLTFSNASYGLVSISCGDDKLIKVWSATTGTKLYTLEGHEAPVYSICPNAKGNFHILFSISMCGELKAWLFDDFGSIVTYDTPGLCCMRMIYSTDGKRLFSCGTNQDGESRLVEWSDAESFITRNYVGLCKFSSDVVQFDTCCNRFLAAGDDHLIKVWDVDSDEMLAAIDSDGGFPANPYLCFNKKGALLAVFCGDNRIKILVNDHGFDSLETPATDSTDPPGCLTKSFGKVMEEEVLHTLGNEEHKEPAESNKFKMSVIPSSRCQSILLNHEVKTSMIRRLAYTNAGDGILALAENGFNLLWRWSKTDSNSSGEATTKVAPQLWQPKHGFPMLNDLPENSSDAGAISCFSLSKNDSYIVSASGGMITLYDMAQFKKIRNVLPSPPAATCIVFYPPDNNIIAVGMNDSTILIYDISLDEVMRELEGHSKRISGLAFSTTSNVLISSGVDTQFILWDSVTWEKLRSTVLRIPATWLSSDESEIFIELEKDQKHFLAVHKTQVSIYEVDTLRRLKQWSIGTHSMCILHATYSCDSQLVYAVMRYGILLILSASDLVPRLEIYVSEYFSRHLRFAVHPVVVAAHPKKPNQLAVGLSDGTVAVMEPHESCGEWNRSTYLDEDLGG